MKTRRLTDLYLTGKEVVVSDGAGEAVTIWLSKLNDLDQTSIVRRANAMKAQHLIDAQNEESELFKALWAQVHDFEDREALVVVVIAEEVQRIRQRIEAQLSTDEDGWGKDEYVQGLFDLWIGDGDNEGLMHRQIDEPDDPEVKRVLAELERFNTEVANKVTAEADELEREWSAVTEDELYDRATHELLKRRSEDIFVREMLRQQLFYAVRDLDDHKKRYFGTITEVDELDSRVREKLEWEYTQLVVDSREGKDSRANPDFSNSSGPQPVETITVPSGPEAVLA
jgi:hypothetical protein